MGGVDYNAAMEMMKPREQPRRVNYRLSGLRNQSRLRDIALVTNTLARRRAEAKTITLDEFLEFLPKEERHAAEKRFQEIYADYGNSPEGHRIASEYASSLSKLQCAVE